MHEPIVRDLHDLLTAICDDGERLEAHDIVRAAVEALALVERLGPAAIARPDNANDVLTCVVADDHPAVLAAAAEALRSNGIEVVGEARDGAEALAKIERLRPRIAILDARMPELDGIEVTRRAAAAAPGTSVVIFSGFADARLLDDALAAGARGVVVKDAPLADLVRAVELVAAGHTYVHPEVTARGLPAATTGLTQRERDVLGLVANGLTNTDIAGRLAISSETVQTHVRKAMAKLQAESRTEAVAKALRLALIE